MDEAERFEREAVRPKRLFVRNKPEVFGRQLFLNADDEITGEEDALLITATSIGADDVQALCRSYGGAAFPAHIDKESYSLLASLGYIDPSMNFSVCEVTPQCDTAALVREHPELAGVRFLRNSDAHDLGPIGLLPNELELLRADPAALVHWISEETKGGAR